MGVCTITVKPDVFEWLRTSGEWTEHGAHEPSETLTLLGWTLIICSCGWQTPICVSEHGAMTSWHAHRRREEKRRTT